MKKAGFISTDHKNKTEQRKKRPVFSTGRFLGYSLIE